MTRVSSLVTEQEPSELGISDKEHAEWSHIKNIYDMAAHQKITTKIYEYGIDVYKLIFVTAIHGRLDNLDSLMFAWDNLVHHSDNQIIMAAATMHQFAVVEYLTRYDSIMSTLTYEQHQEIIELAKQYEAHRVSEFFETYLKYVPQRELARMTAGGDTWLPREVTNIISGHVPGCEADKADASWPGIHAWLRSLRKCNAKFK